ncbi:tetratricopeptide repeat-containing sensor histidine kinase [Flavitalea sp.]|nr:sensor histidine kinase [Flavitalea sp.]
MRHLPIIPFLLSISEIFLLPTAKGQHTGTTEANNIIQQLRSGIADTPRVQMLLRLSAYYVNRTLDPVADMDSALVLASQALSLAHRLKFASGKEDAVFLKGRIFIGQQNTVKLQQMLADVSSKNSIKLLLELGKSMLRTTYLQKGNRDSSIILFQKAGRLCDGIGNQELKEESQCLIGIVYLLNGDWYEGKNYFTHVIEARQKAGDRAGELNALLRMATTVFCDNCEENIIALNRALELSRQIGDQSQEALIRLIIGYKHLNDGNARQAEEDAIAALNIQNAIGYPAICHAYKALAEQSVYYSQSDYGYLSNAYYLLSDLSQIKGDLNQKLFYILKVVDNVESSGMPGEFDYTYFRLGNAYWELGLFDKSMEYHRQSAAISNQKGEFIEIGIARRMTVALIKQGKIKEALLLLQDFVSKNLLCSLEDKMYIAQSLGSCYNALKQFSRAEKYYLESVAWSKESPLTFQFVACQGISQFYVTNGQYSKAKPYLQQLLNASRQQLLPNYLIEVYLMWFKVDSASQNYKEAIGHYQRYKALQDSVYNETKSRQIAQLSIQYETAKKEQDIKIKGKDIELLKKQNRLQQNQRNALIIGTGLLAAILALGFNRYRLKQRVNRQLKSQQKSLNLQQQQIKQKNEYLSEVLTEKDLLLLQKDILLEEKDRLLIEKELLLKEIHHRIKNNLQVVMSLLNSQASSIQNKSALAAIQESQHRVQAMALIHQKLYQNQSLARIDMSSYINEVAAYLHESYSLPQLIRLNLYVEPIHLDVTLAVPLGLIINEAITNAFKYAFPDERPGTISLKLIRQTENTYQLIIEDDGVGLHEGFDPSESPTLGMTLMHGFGSQLGGELTITSVSGVSVSLIFVEQQNSPIHTSVGMNYTASN